jgi:hypothetical protein
MSRALNPSDCCIKALAPLYDCFVLHSKSNGIVYDKPAYYQLNCDSLQWGDNTLHEM